MTLPDAAKLYDAVEATWPAASEWRLGPWTLRDGKGGGKRVSAATAASDAALNNISMAEAAMEQAGQTRLFMLRDGETALDGALESHGYEVIDPVTMYACPVEQLTDAPVPPVTAFAIWEPLAIQRDIWAAGGIGPARVAVMERAQGPRAAILGRWHDTPAGTAFVGMHDKIGMVHALEVLPQFRREGMARWIMRKAAFWTAEQGGHTLSVICTTANVPANRLYASLGFEVVGQYHYRIKTA